MILFKFGSFNFLDYIQLDTYSIIPNARMDVDSYTDGNGLLHRNALSHTKSKITFTLWELSEDEMREVMNGLTSNYINYNERDANCTYFDPETFTEKTGHFYLDSNMELKIKEVRDGKFVFNAITLTFVEY